MMQKTFFSILVIIILSLGSCENLQNSFEEKLDSNKKNNQGDITLQIYFDKSSDKKILIEPEIRQINKCEYNILLIMEELIKGPSSTSGLSPVLPKNTDVLSISVKDDIAIIDLSKECKVPMSEKKEEACLRSIITSILELKEIKKVKINIESNPNDSFGGNFDLSNSLDIESIPMAKYMSK